MRFLLLTVGALVLGSGAALADPSSFQRSCDDIQVEVAGDDAYITAQCKDRRGRHKSAQIALTGYQNDDGFLKKKGHDRASFQRSCDQYWLDIAPQAVFLNGNCRTRRGDYRQSRVEVRNIHNDDGRLVGR